MDSDVGFLRRDLEVDETLPKTNEIAQFFTVTLIGGVASSQNVVVSENLFSLFCVRALNSVTGGFDKQHT